MFIINISSQEIKAFTIDSWPPFMYSEDGNIKGLATEIVRKVFDLADVSLEIQVAPWARAYKNATELDDAMIYMLFRTIDRESLFQWVGPIIPAYDMYFYKLKNRTDISFDSLDEAKQFTIGVVRNVANHNFLLSKGFTDGVNLSGVSTPQQNI